MQGNLPPPHAYPNLLSADGASPPQINHAVHAGRACITKTNSNGDTAPTTDTCQTTQAIDNSALTVHGN